MQISSQQKAHLYFGCFLFFEAIWLFLMIDELSLSSYESRLLTRDAEMFPHLVLASVNLLGENNYGYRLPIYLLYLCNLTLFYSLAAKTLSQPFDALWAVIVFSLTPMANLSALIVGGAGITLCLTLMILYAHLTSHKKLLYILLVISLWVSPSFIILYIACLSYAFFDKDHKLFIMMCFLIAIRIYLGNLGIFGVPKAYFLDTIGIFALLFSPLLFIYYTYALYRILIKEPKDLIWHVSFVALIFCLILSMRQKLPLDLFVPFMCVGIISCAKIFLSGLRVRLKPFKKVYIVGFKATFCVLIICFLSLTCNKFFYPLLQNPKDHFAYRFHIANELAQALKNQNIHAIYTRDTKLANRLKRYGIKKGSQYALSQTSTRDAKHIPIKYMGAVVANYYLIQN